MSDATHLRRVTLGCPGAWATEDAAADHYTTRVGGMPNFPGGQTPPDYLAPICAACGLVMSMVLQAFAPLSGTEAGVALPERLLFVFGCARKGCAPSPASWRALRCQLPAAHPQHSPAPAPASTSTNQLRSCTEAAADLGFGERGCWSAGSAPAAPPVTEDWGASAADWSMDEPLDWRPTDATLGSGAFDFADLDAALDARTLHPTGVKDTPGSASAAATPQPAASGVQSAEACLNPSVDSAMEDSPTLAATGSPAPLTAEPGKGVPVSGRGMLVSVSGGAVSVSGGAVSCSGPLLPAFYLHALPEPAGGEASSRCGAPGEEAHVHELLQRYGQEDAKAPDPAASPSASWGEWVGEAYEPDTARSADAAFLKFTRRLQRCPSQCVRYGFGQQPVWPTKSAPAPRLCDRCGGPRLLELQLVPGLLHALDEGLAWHSEQGAGQGASIDDWNWLSIAMFTCAGSCDNGGLGLAVTQEQLEVCLE